MDLQARLDYRRMLVDTIARIQAHKGDSSGYEILLRSVDADLARAHHDSEHLYEFRFKKPIVEERNDDREIKSGTPG